MKVKQFFIHIKNKLMNLFKKENLASNFRITYDIFTNIVLFLIISGGLIVIFAGGVGAGYFASLVKDEPIRDYEEMEKDIYNYEETSKLYFANNIYIGDIRADIHREEIELKDVSDLVKQAVIATEDDLFYEHNGIVPKAIVRAIFQEATNATKQTGGSTLTQQLIKNQLLTNEVSFERKAKEILLAMRLENFFEKDEILEAYLNIVPYGREASGRNIAGIQTAAMGIFGVDADELNLPQAAFLAGLPQNPFTFTPFTNKGEIKEEEALEPGLNRMKTVLKRMYQTNIINEEEYEEALQYDIVADFTEKSISPIDEYPAIVFELEERATKILTEMIANDDGYTLEEVEEDEELKQEYTTLADQALRRNGYHIHSTINKDMYDKMQQIVKDYPYFGPDRAFTKDGETVTEHVENGMVIIENETGKVLSFVPGRDYRAGDREFNYATQAYRSPGSTFKPYTYAVGFDTGSIQPGSVIADIPTSYGSYSPKNYGGGYYGLVTVREAITSSYNIPAVKAYSDIMGESIYHDYFSKMNFNKLDAIESDNRALPLGGLTHGITVEENTNAFSVFANNGQFKQSYMIEKITDSDGNVIYEHETEPEEVLSPQTAYLMIDVLRDVVRGGTASYLPSQLKHGGVDWVGKTGTSQDYKDAWFLGMNPKVTIGSWIGYDTPHSIYCPGCGLSYHQRNMKLWAEVVNTLSDDFPELMAPQERFQQPEGIVSRSFCAISGLLPSKLCSDAGLVRSDIFNSQFVPTKEDDSLIGGNMPLVTIDGKQVVASDRTPEEFISKSKGGFSFNPEFLERMGYDKLGDLSMLFPRHNREAWEKIGFGGTSIANDEIDIDRLGTPPAPSSLDAKKNKITWSHQTGNYIVGYRIYYSSNEGGKASTIGHTTDSSYTLPKDDGYYHVRAVNYFGEESEPSAQIIIESNKKDKEKKEKDKKKEKKKEKEKDKEKNNKDKEKNNKDKENNDKKEEESSDKEKEEEDDHSNSKADEQKNNS